MDKPLIKITIAAAIEKDPLKDSIRKVSLFGSRADGGAKETSDIDVLIEFDPEAKIGFFKLAQIRRNMEDAVKKEVDLVTPEALSKYFRADVLAGAETVYEKQ